MHTPYIKLYITACLYTVSIYISIHIEELYSLHCILPHAHNIGSVLKCLAHSDDCQTTARMAPDVAALISHNIKSCLANLSEP